MGTRALFTFKDESCAVNVYKHWDGYPRGAMQFVQNALPYAWQLPRFEADEFAAAFIAANKDKGGGDLRILPTGAPKKVASTFASDIEYRYEITCDNGLFNIKAIETHYGRAKPLETVLYNGPFAKFAQSEHVRESV